MRITFMIHQRCDDVCEDTVCISSSYISTVCGTEEYAVAGIVYSSAAIS